MRASIRPGTGHVSSAVDVDRLRATDDALLALSSTLSTPAFSGIASDLAHAGIAAVLTLMLGLAAAAYVVLRPLASAFRIKRMLFNLASEPDLGLADTWTTWHVRRSVGLYEEER